MHQSPCSLPRTFIAPCKTRNSNSFRTPPNVQPAPPRPTPATAAMLLRSRHMNPSSTTLRGEPPPQRRCSHRVELWVLTTTSPLLRLRKPPLEPCHRHQTPLPNPPYEAIVITLHHESHPEPLLTFKRTPSAMVVTAVSRGRRRRRPHPPCFETAPALPPLCHVYSKP